MTTTKKISELPSAVTPLQGDEVVPVVQDGATRRATIDEVREGLAADDHNHTLEDIADAGSAAGAEIADFATAAQGAKADSALQAEDIGSAAYNETEDFATAAQGANADSAIQPEDLEDVATSGDYDDLINAPQPGLINAVINGGCMVSHRGELSLSDSWQYGPVDLLAVTAEGTVSAGTIKQFTGAYSLTETGAACMVENATLTGSGKINFRHRIESKNARPFANKAAHFSARTYHDSGATLDYTITINKADSEDDFATVTEIDSDTVSVNNDTNDGIAFSVADMGDCRNGIEIIVSIDCGAITTKDFFLGQLQFSIGANQRPFEMRPASLEEKLVHRFLRPIGGILGVANSGSNMQAVFSHPGMRAAPSYEVNAPIAMTDGYTADFTQSEASITNVHENNAHHGRVDIAYFSGLTSGRFHIQRGTGGLILASAEL
ncbi:MAG: hypothetical protein H6859_00415 [Rhodospirillales bacterium]|nr:hypothetical protein [Alphaproteobacteria bacterium]USO05705.1 MAG: hypothetical protein H6859_00415 [Rhodospirillales bacterium]